MFNLVYPKYYLNCNQYKTVNVIFYIPFFHTKPLKSGMHFTFIAHLNMY